MRQKVLMTGLCCNASVCAGDHSFVEVRIDVQGAKRLLGRSSSSNNNSVALRAVLLRLVLVPRTHMRTIRTDAKQALKDFRLKQVQDKTL